MKRIKCMCKLNKTRLSWVHKLKIIILHLFIPLFFENLTTNQQITKTSWARILAFLFSMQDLNIIVIPCPLAHMQRIWCSFFLSLFYVSTDTETKGNKLGNINIRQIKEAKKPQQMEGEESYGVWESLKTKLAMRTKDWRRDHQNIFCLEESTIGLKSKINACHAMLLRSSCGWLWNQSQAFHFHYWYKTKNKRHIRAHEETLNIREPSLMVKHDLPENPLRY